MTANRRNGVNSSAAAGLVLGVLVLALFGFPNQYSGFLGLLGVKMNWAFYAALAVAGLWIGQYYFPLPQGYNEFAEYISLMFILLLIPALMVNSILFDASVGEIINEYIVGGFHGLVAGYLLKDVSKGIL